MEEYDNTRTLPELRTMIPSNCQSDIIWSSPLHDPMQSPLGPRQISRSHDMYFVDGNLVLLAGCTAFRVYKGLLAKHSPVFQDMIQLGSPTSEIHEEYDDCPMVTLSDRAEEVLQLLKTFHGRFNFDTESPMHLAHVLRLSAKYMVDPIRITAFKKLVGKFPSKLTDWSRVIIPMPEECGEIIKAALEANTDILLPSAYYALCRADVDEVFLLGLPAHALEAYFRGKHALNRAIIPLLADIIARMPHHFAVSCHDPKKCQELMAKLKHEVIEILRRRDPAAMPFEIIQSFSLMDVVVNQCSWCRAYLEGKFALWLQKTWLELPLFFGCRPWIAMENSGHGAAG